MGFVLQNSQTVEFYYKFENKSGYVSVKPVLQKLLYNEFIWLIKILEYYDGSEAYILFSDNRKDLKHNNHTL